MTKSEYFEFSEKFFQECIDISKKKNADYTGGNTDPFANFKAVEILGISTEQGFLTRMMDKMKRISSFAENGQLLVEDESVLDTLQDLANYSCLLAGYIKSKECVECLEPTYGLGNSRKSQPRYAENKYIDRNTTEIIDRLQEKYAEESNDFSGQANKNLR